MNVYQFYQVMTGKKLITVRAIDSENAKKQFLDFFREDNYDLSEVEFTTFKKEVVGLNLEKLRVKTSDINQYIKSEKRNLELMNFSVWSSEDFNSEINRELVAYSLSNFAPLYCKEFILAEFGKNCLGYLNEYIYSGNFVDVFEFLNENDVENFKVGALDWNVSFAYSPVSVKKWLEWYSYMQDEMIYTNEEAIFMPYYDEYGCFVEYPFDGKDVLPELIDLRNRNCYDNRLY